MMILSSKFHHPLLHGSAVSSNFSSRHVESLQVSTRSKNENIDTEKKITSTSNPFVKHCVKLRQSSSYRRSCGTAVVVGITPILEICKYQELHNNEPSIVECLLLLDGVGSPRELDDFCTSIMHVSPNVMKKLSGVQSIDSTEGIAVMRFPKSFYDMDVSQVEEANCCFFVPPRRILVLDGIQDPGNLGTLLRSAMAFKWDGVFLLPGCCDPFNEKALRASRGASFQLPLISGNWSHLDELRAKFQMRILAGHPGNRNNSDDASQKQPITLTREFADSLATSPLCLVLGSEGNGLSTETRQSCELVSIPMEGMFESLNVSVAGGIFLHMLQPQQCR